MSGIAQQGVNSVSQLNFTIDDPKKLQSEARAQAIADAKVKAQAIAIAGGFRVGRLLSIEEGGSSWIQPAFMYGAMSKDASMTRETHPAAAIEPGSQDVQISVVLRYEIE